MTTANRALLDLAADELFHGKIAFERAFASVIPPTPYERAMIHTLRSLAITSMISAAQSLNIDEMNFDASLLTTVTNESDSPAG